MSVTTRRRFLQTNVALTAEATAGMKREKASGVPRTGSEPSTPRLGLMVGVLVLSLLAWPGRGDADEKAPFVAGVDHLAIRVTDMQQSGEFYARLFGPAAKKPPQPIIAHPTSVPSPHYWVRMGASYLAISLASPENGPPGFDHPCINFGGITAEGMARKLATLNRQYEKPVSYDIATDFWARDPAGNLLQIDSNPEGYWDRLDALARAVPAEELAAIRGKAVFQTIRIAHIAVEAKDLEASANYYRRLLGDSRARRGTRSFRAGPARVALEPESGEAYFGVEVAGFDRAEVAKKLRELGISGVVENRDEDVVELRDPDGIKLQIRGSAVRGADRPEARHPIDRLIGRSERHESDLSWTREIP